MFKIIFLQIYEIFQFVEQKTAKKMKKKMKKARKCVTFC